MNPARTLATTCHPCAQKGTGSNMLFDPPERNVNPLLHQARIRTMKELVLALTIHDQKITMVKPARISFSVRTKRARAPKLIETMSFGSPRSPNSGSLSLCQATRENRHQQRFRFAAVRKTPSAHQGFIRGATALPKPVSSGQHRSQYVAR